MEIKQNQIAGIVLKNDFMHINLMGTEKTFQHFNTSPKDLKKKITAILKDIRQNPDEKFSVSCKRVPNGDLWVYQIENKKFLNEAPVQNTSPIFYQQNQQLEKFQTLDAYKMQMEKIAQLEKELELIKMENMYRNQLNEKPIDSPMKSFSENIMPMFLPLLDKFLDNQKLTKEIQLSESQKKNLVSNQNSNLKKIPFRPVPKVDTELWESYLDYIENLNTENFDKECLYLEKFSPSEYKIIYDTFLAEDNTETNESTN
jgi:hypothetical protein